MIRNKVSVVVFVVLALVACADTTPEGRLAAAKAHLAKNEVSAAVIELKNALQKNPKLAEARLLLGTALIETGDAPGAETELRRALEYGAPANEVTAPLARALVNQGQYKNVVDQFSAVDLGAPERQADLTATLGEAQLGLRQVEAARREFAKALALRSDHVPALLGSARVKLATGDLPGALAFIKTALEAAPKSLTVRLMEAELLTAGGRLDEALASYRTALGLYPKSPAANIGAIPILIDQGKLDEAGKQLDVLKRVAPKRPETQFLQAYYDYRRKNITAARESVQRFLVAQPDNLRGLLLAAGIEYEAKAYAQAEAHLKHALARAPNATPARRMLVANYLRAGKHSEAVEALQPLLPRADKDATTLALAGETYLATGNVAKAEPYFAKATELDPGDHRKLTGLGLSHLAQGRFDEGFRELEKAAASDEAGGADMALYAAAMRKRDYVRALAAVDSLEKKRPKHPTPPNLRGLVLLAQGDVAGARKQFERALELDPAFFSAAANLGRLDMRDKRPEAAQKRFEAVLAKNPKSSESLLAIAEIKARQNAPAEEVAALIARAITANPQFVPARVALINYRLRTKDGARAVTAAQEAQSAIPDRPEIMDAAGRAFEAAGSGQQALATYNRWARVQPTSPVPYLRIANLQIAAKDHVAADVALRRALEIKPDFLDAQQRLVMLDLLRNRRPQAIETARSVQKQRPTEPAGYLLEGDIHAAAKEWPAAIAIYRTGLAKTDSVHLAVRLHGALLRTKSADAAKFAADRLSKHPKQSLFRVHLAEAALSRGEWATAAEHYKVLLETNRDNAGWLNNLAIAANALNDPQALAYAEKAATLAPNDPAVMDTLGFMLAEKGDTARAIDLLRKATEAAPQASVIRLNLAKAYLKSGQKSAAKTELETLAKLGPKFAGHSEVETLLKTL